VRLTSLISYPPNGQLPALTTRGQELAPLFRSDHTQQVFDSVNDFDAWEQFTRVSDGRVTNGDSRPRANRSDRRAADQLCAASKRLKSICKSGSIEISIAARRSGSSMRV
jgi:curved DNA-binding protein CbpA